MLKLFKSRRNSHVSLALNDYVLRVLVAKEPDLGQAQCYDVPLARGIVEEGVIMDEMALFEVVKAYVPEWGGKRQHVRFFVPDTSVLLKVIEHPSDITEPKELRGYVQLEIGHSIHLPFQEPLVDVVDPNPEDGKAVIFAAPPEEVRKFMEIVQDSHLKPQVADIRALANLRLLESLDLLSSKRTYLIADWSINELSICIYSRGNVDFLRFQTIDTDLEKWQAEPASDSGYDVSFLYKGDLQEYRMTLADQVLELDRIMNFFKFSLHKGEKSVDDIIILGDNPLLPHITALLAENFANPIIEVDDALIGKKYPGFKAKHAALLGLALKEVDV
ncbi:MAG: type IV pilus biogenesis protein PilM [Lysinibacillus sp.]